MKRTKKRKFARVGEPERIRGRRPAGFHVTEPMTALWTKKFCLFRGPRTRTQGRSAKLHNLRPLLFKVRLEERPQPSIFPFHGYQLTISNSAGEARLPVQCYGRLRASSGGPCPARLLSNGELSPRGPAQSVERQTLTEEG
ncbi:hypothetical protein NDU88_005076 [Pleurodeles waltl]|uniref:Uncharacterized protein n=1 Tax=Pleurodeles waltl TaxID=8319 RepID=A0AAV7TBJ6_PLEWA|nr:hypothetical protein NDU88_005076 [Pleurodeles waltl]